MRALSTTLLASILVLSFLQPLLGQRPHPPLLVTVDHNNDFVLTGIGQPVVGIEFSAPEGVMEHSPGSELFRDPETGDFSGSAPAPFTFRVGGTDEFYYAAPLGGSVVIEGSYPMLFGPHDLERLGDIELLIAYENDTTPYDNPLGFICQACSYPDATVTPDGGIEVTNIMDPIIRISVFSNDGGLQEVTEVPAGASIVQSTATRLVIENPDGFQPTELENFDFLGRQALSADAFIKFDLSTGSSYGPMPVARAVPEPSGVTLIMLASLGLLGLRKRRD